MDKTQIAAMLRTHGPTVVALASALATAGDTDKALLPDVADVLDGKASAAGTALKHLGVIGTLIGLLEQDQALLADLRGLIPHK